MNFSKKEQQEPSVLGAHMPQPAATVLMQTATALLAMPLPEEVWPIIFTAVDQLFLGQASAILLYDAEEAQSSCAATHHLAESHADALCHLFDFGLEPLFTQLTKPTIVGETQTPAWATAVAAHMTSAHYPLGILLPFVPADTTLPLGALIIYRLQATPFTAADIENGRQLAQMASTTLANALYLADIRLNLMREQRLNQIAYTMVSTLDLPTILSQVLHQTADLIGADAGLLGLIIDHQVMTFYPHNIPSAIVLRPAPRGRGIAWEVVQTRQTLHIPNYPTHHLAQKKWLNVGLSSLLAVPITVAENCLGVLILFNLHHNHKGFTPQQINLIEIIGRQVGIAIQHTRMYAEATQRSVALRTALSRQAELDELKNKFIQNVSHELRTPLGIIHGHTELLTLGAMGELNPKQQESIEIISRRVHMLIDMVNDLTSMLAAETQELRREDIDLSLLLYSMLEEYRLQAQKAEITLEASITEQLPSIKGDVTHLRRLLDNLTANALKFTPAGGKIIWRLWADATDIVLEVADTGMGIAPEQLKHIFERFYQATEGTKRRYGGTGLGLALVKEIAEAHRGQVSATSELGVGSTFRVTFPIPE